MKKSIIWGLMLICELTYSQYNSENLKKYWYYKQRFLDNFIVISSDNEQGTNIPTMIVGEDGKMNWNDGNAGLQYYIGMLATEYRLLKDHNLDYQNTLQQLDYAIKAIERLDYTAESYWNGGFCSNGYFIRDDVYAGLAEWAVNSGKNPNFSNRTLTSTFTDYSPALENSQDNVWNYLPNLALVVKLVDEPNIVTRVRKLAGDMVNHMHGYDFFSCPADNKDLDYDCPGGWELNIGYTAGKCYLPAWIIRNPTTEDLARYGGHIYEGTLLDHTGRQWGFAEAAKFITGNDHHYNNSSDERLKMEDLAVLADNDDSYSFKQLFAVIGYFWGYISNKFDASNPYHEHIPLVWDILHENLNLEETDEWSSVYENLLNLAPSCGPHYYSNGDHQQFWDFKNRLNSNQGSPINPTYGDFNGIDYMLLHNLYWLVYHPVKNLAEYYPQPSGYGGNNNPAIIKGGNINSSDQINPGAHVTYNADAQIVLNPGFTAYNGVVFDAYINGSIPVYNEEALDPICNPIGQIGSGLKSTSKFLLENSSFSDNLDLKENEFKIELSPNPVKDILFIKIINKDSGQKTKIEVLNNSSNLINSVFIDNNNYELDMSNFNAGIYILKIFSGTQFSTYKIIKE